MPEFVEYKKGKWQRNKKSIKDWADQVRCNNELIKFKIPLCPIQSNFG